MNLIVDFLRDFGNWIHRYPWCGNSRHRWSDESADIESLPWVTNIRRAVHLTIGSKIEAGNPTMFSMIQTGVSQDIAQTNPVRISSCHQWQFYLIEDKGGKPSSKPDWKFAMCVLFVSGDSALVWKIRSDFVCVWSGLSRYFLLRSQKPIEVSGQALPQPLSKTWWRGAAFRRICNGNWLLSGWFMRIMGPDWKMFHTKPKS